MRRVRKIVGIGIATTIAGALAVPPAAVGQGPPDQHRASVSVEVRGLDGGRVTAGDRVTLAATLRPFQQGEKLKLLLLRDGKVVARQPTNVHRVPGADAGRATLRSKPLTEPGRYAAHAIHYENPALSKARDSSRPFRISYPALHHGDSGRAVRTFNDLLARHGYGNAPGGDSFNAATGRAVHAFRKVNGMSRNESVSGALYQRLAAGKGAFELRYPGAGKHVEIDVSRQVMVLASGGAPQYTYHVSTGKSSTPSDRGMFRFYSKDPGYNSLGMYYSVYYNGGEATHGYASVPDYPASHGCIRNPIPDAVFIYNWIEIGDPVWVYL